MIFKIWVTRLQSSIEKGRSIIAGMRSEFYCCERYRGLEGQTS